MAEEKKLNLFQKIAKARTMFLETKVKKTGLNKFAGYDYFQLDDILPTCLRICEQVGICPIISFDKDLASMRVFDNDNDDKYIEMFSPMDGANLKGCHEIQNTGARETYSRRYLWFALFEITEPDALDSTQGSDDSKPKQSQKPAPAQKPDYSGAWADLIKFMGWTGQDKTKDDEAKNLAHEALKDMKISIKHPKELTKANADAIASFIAEHSGPETFDDSDVPFGMN